MPADLTSSELEKNVLVNYQRLSWTSRLARDYSYAFEKVADHYASPPGANGNWSNIIKARQSLRPDTAVSDVLEKQLVGRQAPTAALDAVKQLRHQESVAVVTGQQAGLFGGPLFTILKALTAIKLARQLADQYRVPVVPVFWVDGEDHDLEEIAHCSVIDTNLALQKTTLPLDEQKGVPASSIRLDETIASTIASLEGSLSPTEFTEQLINDLKAAYRPGVRLVESFARWLDQLFGHHGLVIYDASDVAMKPFVQQLFMEELKHPGRTSRLAATAGAELESSGYHAQVAPAHDAVALFRIDGTRQAIKIAGDDFRVGTQTLTADEIFTELEQRPSSFSPNVLLRPITQDVLFPTIAYVSGPSELGYLGQLRQVYETFNIPMPVIYPRATATVVDMATLKFLDRYKVDFCELHAQDDSLLNALLTSQIPTEVEQALQDAEQTITERLNTLNNVVQKIDPTLAGTVKSTRGRMEKDLRSLRTKIIQAAKRRDETLRRQFNRARSQAFPSGEPQERAVAGVYFLNKYGSAFINRLFEELPIDPGDHWLLNI